MATATTHAATQYHWDQLPKEAIGTKVTRRFFNGDRMTIARLELKKGGRAKSHSHDAEEVMCVLKGAVIVKLNDEEVVVTAGAVMDIPGGVVHEIVAAEDSEILDAFSPIRQDWLDKKDTYYER